MIEIFNNEDFQNIASTGEILLLQYINWMEQT